MKNFSLPQQLLRQSFWILLPLLIYISLKLLPNYGIAFDSPKNFIEGATNLNAVLSRQPLSRLDEINLAYQTNGSFFFMLSEIAKRFFSDRLHLLDETSARHCFLPFLVLFFGALYFRTIKQTENSATALVAFAILWTTPHFFGNSFHNVKDIPLFVSFSTALLFFFDWTNSRFTRTSRLYFFFIAWGFALVSKIYAVLIPVIALIWLALLFSTRTGPFEKNRPLSSARQTSLWNFLPGLILTAGMVLFFFAPGLFRITDFQSFWNLKFQILKQLSGAGRGWSFYALSQIIFTTPLLTLSAIALFACSPRFRPFDLLMLVWALIVIGLPCTPFLPAAEGIQSFITGMVPLSYFAARGIFYAAEIFSEPGRLPPLLLKIILSGLVIGTQLVGIFSTHPYETTYYNGLAGGLEGAQKKNLLRSENYYWISAFHEGTKWLNNNAEAKSVLLVPDKYCRLMLTHCPVKKELPFDFIRQLPLPHNSYLMLPQDPSLWLDRSLKNIRLADLREEVSRMEKVHEIKRQGGEILNIFYKP